VDGVSPECFCSIETLLLPLRCFYRRASSATATYKGARLGLRRQSSEPCDLGCKSSCLYALQEIERWATPSGVVSAQNTGARLPACKFKSSPLTTGFHVHQTPLWGTYWPKVLNGDGNGSGMVLSC
jgi:hypothetical protein